MMLLKDKKVLGRVKGYGNANDSYHQTASSPEGEGAYLAMQKALTVAELLPNEIEFIHAHGTATRNNDLSESTAIRRVFDNDIPDFSSTKGFTGHTLAAAGGIQAVLNLLMLKNQEVFPNLNFHQCYGRNKFISCNLISKRKKLTTYFQTPLVLAEIVPL